MDWLKIIQPRVHDKVRFTLSILQALLSIVIILTVINWLTPIILLRLFDILAFRALINPNNNSLYWLPEAILLVVFALFILWILAVFVPLLVFTVELITSRVPFFNKTKNILPNKDLGNLIFQGGNIEVLKGNILHILNSERGVLFKNHLWRDFKAEFDFDLLGKAKHRITADNYVGFIFRASDLDNYFMISIGYKYIKEKNSVTMKVLITPHVRLDGKWEALSQETFSPRDFEPEGFNGITCIVKGNTLDLILNGIKFAWNIPTNFQSAEKEVSEKKFVFGDTSLIGFRNSFGMIGFRVWVDEEAYISKLVVTEL